MPEFVHLHCHTQYSLLDGACEIGTMMRKAAADGQKGVALTDHGNMFGAFKFVAEAEKAGVKPIIGCEFYLVEDRHIKSFSKSKGEKDKRHHQLLLAKNRQGYENLCKLCSLGFIEGLYSKFPRIDKELLVKYKEGLIATSCCIGAEIPQAIIHYGAKRAEELLKWWIDLFGTDFYIELQRHRGLENIDGLGISQEDINQILIKFARKYQLKLIATNDAHYIDEEDSLPHDLLLCINTNSLVADEKRFRFSSSDYYFKTQKEMNVLFHDVPESIDNTLEIYDKIEPLTLTRDVLLPNFPLPEGFKTQDDYLRHLTFEGAKRRYGTITPEIEERLNFELNVIKNSGYPGYFLIVQDFTTTALKMGVSVGPGRGSAAGSAVAYCINITNVDPIKYDLLFERFLNPERISMPDIDIDFDDEGRQKVIDYVIDKYGKNQVAQIVTYGSMAAKSSLRDVGRVMNVPLSEVDKVAKSFPVNLAATLNKVLAEGDILPKLKGKMNAEDVEKAYQFRQLAAAEDQIGEMIRLAKNLEGSVRNTGIHACGVIITPDDITNYVPVKTDKHSGMLVSQFDNSVAEEAGLLKMDFLGLKTLTIIRDAVRLVKQTHGIDLVPDEFPLDDHKTYELFQRGDTVGIFQYESTGMQKYLKELKPTKFEDIIAMNALYRPGPLEYIPEFIERKHGRKPVTYDLDDMEEYLHETYGICVTGDTLIHNAKTGQQVRIDTLKNQVSEFLVQGVDENLETQFAKISYWVCNGKKPVFEVKLKNGTTVKMTRNHQVLTESGWKKLEELDVGVPIAVPKKLETMPDKLHPKISFSPTIFSYKTTGELEVLAPLKNTLTDKKEIGVNWEKIVSITPVGEELVYDITVEDIHNFVGNNIILHNCVYQEQVMLLSQKLANFSKGEADTLRKAMGKKLKPVLDKMWPKFLEGCTKNGHPEKTVEKVWKDWEAFASYAFNKSHSTCYALVAFQTAYLKAHYPAEFMASVLTHNKSDISKVTFFLRECKRMEMEVLGPNVNESQLNFTVNDKGQIRFGMSALKGVGEGPVEAFIEERSKNGHFGNVFDMARRLNLKAMNKRIMESLALGGGFDCFEGIHRAQYFAPSDKYDTLIEHILKYGNAYQLQKAQNVNSLFGASDEILIPEPPMPIAEQWSLIDKLTREKEVTGIFISGHPLDDYKIEVDNFTTCSLEKAENIKGQPLKLAGIVAEANHRISKKGTGFGFFTIQDYNGSMEFPLFSEDYQKFKHLFELGQALFIHGSFQKKWSGDGFQFKINKVELLENIATNLTNSLTLRIPIESLTKELVHNIEMTCKAHKGKHKLKVQLIDRTTKIKLDLVAKTHTVNADNDLIAKLKKLGVVYQLN